MSSPSLRADFIDLYLRIMAEKYPNQPVSRDAVEAAIAEVGEDGRVIFADAGKQNLDPNTIEFIKLGATILGGVLSVGAGMLSVGAASLAAWTAWQKKKTEEAAAEAEKKLDATTPKEKQMIQNITIIVQQDADGRATRIVGRLTQRR